MSPATDYGKKPLSSDDIGQLIRTRDATSDHRLRRTRVQ
jgi:hypothetical protein